jgi:regulator of Ty1 transposition protein 103
MAFSDDAFKAKLSTLNETQDSIVSVSQWIQFHRRHAERIANVWLTRLRDAPPPKRLNFIYLVNDIVQNARARKRTEFPDAFAPLIAEAMQTAYRSSTPEIQAKIRRVLNVWQTRTVFDAPIVEAVEARLNEIDKSKGTSGGKKTLMGKSLFGGSGEGSVPPELEPLVPLQTAVTKAIIDARPAVDASQKEYTSLNDPEAVQPTPPVYAARLSGLIKQLSNAETALSASIKARQSLIKDLERILEVNKSALEKDEQTFMDLGSRKTSTEAKKRDVEDAIMRGLTAQQDSPNLDEPDYTGDRPEVEELTPEPEDATTGDGGYQPSNPAVAAALSGFGDGGFPTGRLRQASGGSLNGGGAKRRKMSHGEDHAVPDLGEMGMENLGREGQTVASALGDLDADVDELLEQAKQG